MAPAAKCGSLTSTPQETENWRRWEMKLLMKERSGREEAKLQMGGGKRGWGNNDRLEEVKEAVCSDSSSSLQWWMHFCVTMTTDTAQPCLSHVPTLFLLLSSSPKIAQTFTHPISSNRNITPRHDGRTSVIAYKRGNEEVGCETAVICSLVIIDNQSDVKPPSFLQPNLNKMWLHENVSVTVWSRRLGLQTCLTDGGRGHLLVSVSSVGQ